MRLRHKPWAKEKLDRHPEIVIQHPAEHRGNWSDVFHADTPLHVEVGTGKGGFITGMSEQYPEERFVGIELAESVIVSALEKALEKEAKNVKLIHGKAQDLSQFFAESEVDSVYLNFSDPWPKNRHEKRRLTHESFLSLYEQILKPEGEIHLKTDNQALFEYSLHSFSKYGMLLKNISLDLHNSEYQDNVMTEYEEKFVGKGNRIYRCEASFRKQR